MVSGIIMASGFAKRIGCNKLMLEINFKPIIEYVIRAAVESSLDEVILVYRMDAVRTVADSYGIKTVMNEDAEKGQSASVKKGIMAANQITDAFLFMVGDQPFLNSKTINQILSCHNKNPGQIIVPMYDNRPGNPVLFPFSFKPDLLLIEGDTGGKPVIQDYKERVTHFCISPSIIGYDIDTPEKFENIKISLRDPQRE